jgi:glycosyltransferase involved in cell wall biosynthesis
MSPPRVSVCMPVSRSAEQIQRSLRGVLAQTLGDYELLVADDGGHGQAVVERIGDPRIRYWRNDPPRGFVGNHEQLLDEAGGELIAFLHDDDAWEPGYLAAAVRALDEHPAAGFALTAYRELPSGAVAPHLPAGFHAEPLPLLLADEMRMLPSATVLRRAALADVRRPWPDLTCGDMVLYLDAALAGWAVVAVTEPLVAYVRHPDQVSAQELRFRTDLARVLELYRFGDTASERLRRQRVARAWLSVARAQLKAGEGLHARASVVSARAADDGPRTRAEAIALRALSHSPRLLRAVLRAWYAVRGMPPTTDAALPR